MGTELSIPRLKNLLYFGEWNFLAPKLKNFRRELSDLKKLKNTTLSFFIYTEKCNLTAQTLKSLIFYPKSKFSYIIAKLEKQKCIIFWEMELSILKNKSFYIYFSSSEFSRSKYYLSELSGEISISSAIYSGMYFSLTNTCLSILLTK